MDQLPWQKMEHPGLAALAKEVKLRSLLGRPCPLLLATTTILQKLPSELVHCLLSLRPSAFPSNRFPFIPSPSGFARGRQGMPCSPPRSPRPHPKAVEMVIGTSSARLNDATMTGISDDGEGDRFLLASVPAQRPYQIVGPKAGWRSTILKRCLEEAITYCLSQPGPCNQ